MVTSIQFLCKNPGAEGHVEALCMLLGAGADANLASNNGCTALMLASQKGHVEAVSLLLEAGADKHFTNDQGYTALMIAFESRHVSIVHLLDASADKNSNKKRRRCFDEDA